MIPLKSRIQTCDPIPEPRTCASDPFDHSAVRKTKKHGNLDGPPPAVSGPLRLSPGSSNDLETFQGFDQSEYVLSSRYLSGLNNLLFERIKEPWLTFGNFLAVRGDNQLMLFRALLHKGFFDLDPLVTFRARKVEHRLRAEIDIQPCRKVDTPVRRFSSIQ